SNNTSDSGERSQKALPKAFELNQNFPNPFNATTQITYKLTRGSNVSLEIYNTMGQKVRTLVDEYRDAGRYTVEWDSKNDAGSDVASGVYLYKMRAGETVDSKKMTLLK
ncbi:MAG: T9SS type A sorting domain-containing protein, partial [candidate division Zixibacteria bacterium]|nr:T9SS type A sorting domain-containing protein [candidate division Zixibacteria bacterium]